MEEKKTNIQMLKEVQDIADEILRKKEEVYVLLNVIDELEIRYFNAREAIKKNTING